MQARIQDFPLEGARAPDPKIQVLNQLRQAQRAEKIAYIAKSLLKMLYNYVIY